MIKLKTFKLFESPDYDDPNDRPNRRQNNGEEEPQQAESNTPFLDSMCKNLTQMAADGKFDPVIGRKKEIMETSWILSRRKKNNPVLIGEAGVGKTAIVEGLAQLIVDKKSPTSLFDKKIYSIDMGSLVAGAKYRGQLEERLKVMIDELAENTDIILFIDEIHMITSTGDNSVAANMLKPALARGDIRCIGATTLNEYRNNIENDAALERRFQKVIVEQTTVAETLEILKRIKDKYEEFHIVTYTDEALELCVKLADKYMSDRFFPDKAIDLLDEVGAKMHLDDEVPDNILNIEEQIFNIRAEKTKLITAGDFEEAAQLRDQERTLIQQLETARNEHVRQTGQNRLTVTAEDVKSVLAVKTGIPTAEFNEEEGAKLLRMHTDLKMSVIGQDEAIDKVSKCIKRNRAGLKDPKKPTGVFLFLGPTGVGKTQLVKSLAKFIFGSESSMIRIDMSEYAAEHNVARLIGAPPGYTGYGEGGQLTEKIRRKPYSIILLDEIEKAHPKVYDVFLQIFDDGVLTDGSGRKVDFKNTIIIMTSNIGSRAVKNMRTPVGFGDKEKQMDTNSKKMVKDALNKKFSPEFLNRIDDVIMFNSLDKENIYKIIDIELQGLVSRLKEMGYGLRVSNNVKDLILDKGWDENMGARPIKRAIQRYIEDVISDELLMKNITDDIFIDYNPTTKVMTLNGKVVDISDSITENITTKFAKFKKRRIKRRRMIKLNDE